MASEGFIKLLGPEVTASVVEGYFASAKSTTEEDESSSSITAEAAAAPSLSPAKLAEMLECMNVGKIEQSPLKKEGPTLPVSIWEPEYNGGGYYYVRVRADMPGVNLLEVTGDPEMKSVLKIKGCEEVITMHGIDNEGVVRRTYLWTLLFDPSRFPELDFAYRFSNGVLNFIIRGTRPASSPADLGVTLKAQETEAAHDITMASAINPLVALGKDRYCHHGFTEKAFVYGVDMPGISENDSLGVRMESKNTIHFFGKERTPADFGEGRREQGREYEGMFKVNLNKLDPSGVQFHISHGVFWIQVPRIVQPPSRLVTLFLGPTHTDKVHLVD